MKEVWVPTLLCEGKSGTWKSNWIPSVWNLKWILAMYRPHTLVFFSSVFLFDLNEMALKRKHHISCTFVCQIMANAMQKSVSKHTSDFLKTTLQWLYMIELSPNFSFFLERELGRDRGWRRERILSWLY